MNAAFVRCSAGGKSVGSASDRAAWLTTGLKSDGTIATFRLVDDLMSVKVVILDFYPISAAGVLVSFVSGHEGGASMNPDPKRRRLLWSAGVRLKPTLAQTAGPARLEPSLDDHNDLTRAREASGLRRLAQRGQPASPGKPCSAILSAILKDNCNRMRSPPGLRPWRIRAWPDEASNRSVLTPSRARTDHGTNQVTSHANSSG